MKASELRKLIGKQISYRRKWSGITDTGTVLSVKGRNVEVDSYGMRDWLWAPDYIIESLPELQS